MKKFAFQLALMCMFLFGAMDMTRSIAGPLLREDWHLTYLQLGNIFAASSFGYLSGSFISGFIVDKLGSKSVILFGGIFAVLGITALLTLNPYVCVILAYLILGIGTGWMEIGVNNIIPKISTSAGEQSQRFNVLHGFYGVGACAFPLIASSLNRVSHGWRLTYILIGVLMIGMILFLRMIKVPGDGRSTSRQHPKKFRGNSFSVFKSPLLYGILFIITIYSMTEAGMGAWLPSYLYYVRHLSMTTSSLYLTGFYLTYTFGRLSAKTWAHRLNPYRAVEFSSIFALIVLASAQIFHQALILFVVAGFGFATIFPTITSIASRTFKENSGMVLGFLFTVAGLGTMFVNWLIGLLSTKYGLAVGFGILPFLLAIVLIGTSITHFWSKRMKQSVPSL